MQSTDVEFLAFPDTAADSWPVGNERSETIRASLPTILLHGTFTTLFLAGAFYWAHVYLAGTLFAGIVVTTVALVVFCGPLGLLAARMTNMPPLTINLGWGCGLTLLMGLFFGVCGLGGAFVALLVAAAGLGIGR